MNNKIKIAGFVLMFILIGGIFYLSVDLEDQTKYNIEAIEISGGRYLSSDQYFEFAKLNDKSKYADLTLAVIKNRLEKHPYISYAEVVYEGSGNVKVELHEKKFEAILFQDEKNYLVTENFVPVPVLPFSKYLDFPLISNPSNIGGKIELKSLRKNDDLLLSFKMITSLKYIDAKLYENLSEIDLRNGRDIVMYFSGFDYPVVVGRNDEIEKLIYFGKLWHNLNEKKLNSYMEYVDLRFNKKIFIGLAG